jgi:hypothetical protein
MDPSGGPDAIPRPDRRRRAPGRPLEYRYSESDLLWFGLHANLRANDRLRFGLGGTWYDETRERPDASGIEWDQIRVVASVSYLFGSGADRLPLPPAVRRRGSR